MTGIFENPVVAKGMAIAAAGVVVGLLLSLGRGLGRLVWKYKQEAVAVPMEEMLPAIALAVTPITKAVYAFVAVMILSQRNLSADRLSILTTWACGVFALVAVVQGALAAKVINTPTAKEGLIGSFRFKLGILGGIETLAVLALGGVIIVSTSLSS